MWLGVPRRRSPVRPWRPQVAHEPGQRLRVAMTWIGGPRDQPVESLLGSVLAIVQSPMARTPLLRLRAGPLFRPEVLFVGVVEEVEQGRLDVDVHVLRV